jgi:hypothetical protein
MPHQPQQGRRRAAEQQVLPGRIGPVEKHAQHREQIGCELHLVDHDGLTLPPAGGG